MAHMSVSAPRSSFALAEEIIYGARPCLAILKPPATRALWYQACNTVGIYVQFEFGDAPMRASSSARRIIKLSAQQDDYFAVTNARNGFSKAYQGLAADSLPRGPMTKGELRRASPELQRRNG
jgi:hypothetical protein